MPEVKRVACKARQVSDQMYCQCGRCWDVNDPDPPECLSQTTPPPLTGNGCLKQLREMLTKGKSDER